MHVELVYQEISMPESCKMYQKLLLSLCASTTQAWKLWPVNNSIVA